MVWATSCGLVLLVDIVNSTHSKILDTIIAISQISLLVIKISGNSLSLLFNFNFLFILSIIVF